MSPRYAPALAACALVLGSLAAAAVCRPDRGSAEAMATASSGSVLFADDVGGTGDLFVLDPVTRARTDLTDSPLVDEAQPSWAPGGGRAAYAAREEGLWRIRVLDLATRASTQVTSGPEDLAPDWSPDGRRLLFTAYFNRGTALQSSFLMTADADGSRVGPVIALMDAARLIGAGRWSPDGARIAFAVVGDGTDAELYSVDADGTRAARLFAHPGWDDLDPAWSPDGRLLAFASGLRQASPATTRHDIWLLDVALGVAGTAIVDPVMDLRRPSWSPDGRYLAFDARDQSGGVFHLHVARATGGAIGPSLTTGRQPDWSGPILPPPTPSETATPSATPSPGTPASSPGTPSPPAVTEIPTAPTLPPFPTPGPTEPTLAPPPPTFPVTAPPGIFLPDTLRRAGLR